MADRDNHYEAAFEAFLRTQQVPYVAVDEAKRCLVAEGSLKSLDFIVSPHQGPAWLVDVKGRKFPGGAEQKQYWKNWTPREDLGSLAAWQETFGERFVALFVFAYQVLGDRAPLPPEELFEYRGARYGFVAVTLGDYAWHARPISQRWDTVAIPAGLFRQLALAVPGLLSGKIALPSRPQTVPAHWLDELPEEPF